MAQHEDLVVELARAYSLSELLPVDDDRIRQRLEHVADGISDTLVVHVRDGELASEDDTCRDEDGSVAELARDLELADVTEVHVPGDVEVANLAAFLRSIREGSGGGDGARTARALSDELPQIGVAFRAPERGGPPSPGSVEAIFARGGESSESGVGDVPSAAEASEAPASGEEADDPEAGHDGTEGDGVADALAAAVDRYLDAPTAERSDLEGDVRRAAEKAAERGLAEDVSVAVERLASEAVSGSGDAGALKMAREILTGPAAMRLAVHLGSLREEEERDALVRAVGELGSEMSVALAQALADTSDRSARRTYIEAMVALGDDARPQVESMLDDSRWFVVRNGVRILGGIGTEEDVEHLTSPLAHDDPRVRRETVMALGRIGGEDAGMLLVGMVDDPEPDVRASSATALGALGVEKAVKVLLERLEREEVEKVQVQIIRALGALGDPGAVPAIEKRAMASFFSRPSPPLRIAGYRALASIGTPHAMELLEQARDDRDEEVRSAVRSLLDARQG